MYRWPLLACLAIPQIVTAEPPGKETPDAASATVVEFRIPVHRHPVYATVTPAATVRLWIDVDNPGGLEDLRFEYALEGKNSGQQPIRLHRKEPNRYRGIITLDLNPLKLTPKQTLSLTVVTGKLRSKRLKFTLADADTVFDNLVKGYVENRNGVRGLLDQLDALKRTLGSLREAIAAGKLADTKNATEHSIAAIAAIGKRLDQQVETSAFLSQAIKDNRLGHSDVEQRTRRLVHRPLVAIQRDLLPPLSQALQRLRTSAKPADQLAAVTQCQAAAGKMRTVLARVDNSYLELKSFHDAVRRLRKIIREQGKVKGPAKR